MAVTSAARAATAEETARPQRRSLGDQAYRENLRYLVFGRAVPAVLFGFMGWLQLSRAITALGAAHSLSAVVHALPALLYAFFVSIPVLIYLSRPKPRRRDGRLVARAAAFSGTLMQLVVGAFLPSGALLFDPPGWVSVLVVAMALAAWAFAVWGLLYLRRSLSIIPEARRLVTGGPYRIVRHPLYCAEITAAVSVVLSRPAIVPGVALLIFVAMQLLRLRFEEALLASAFPEYPAYAARTRRIVPLVW